MPVGGVWMIFGGTQRINRPPAARCSGPVEPGSRRNLRYGENRGLDTGCYASPRGGRVPGYLIVPAGRGPFAGIIFMHGAGGNRVGVLSQAIMYAKMGAVSLAIDAPMSGGRAIPGEQF